MCCAAIDTKGRYNSPQEYVKALAFDLPNRCDVPQLGFIGGDIVPILFIVASTYSPETVEASGTQCGLSTFVLARAVDGKRPDGTVFVNWHLNPGHDTISPMQKFRDTLIRTADEWEERHRSRPTS
jgi:hypothetical protein